jgi:NAD(P)-dependent dehydrogenase (short-subunit alcohol dehydrogenase family)
MGTYAVSGAASGMGRACAERLRRDGHEVIGIDLRDVAVIADLSAPGGRAAAIAGVLELCAGRLDGAVMAAGVGPEPGREAVLAQVNFLGVTELLVGLRPALAAAGTAKVVAFCSNAATITPAIPPAVVRAFLGGRVEQVPELLAPFGIYAPSMAYGGAKLALARWLRRAAVSKDWAGAGIRLNAIAPGPIRTPLLDAQLSGALAQSVLDLPVPIGGYGEAGQIAEWVALMLSPAADFMCGAIVFVDGGTDAYFRGSDWPATTPPSGLARWFARQQAWLESRQL